MTGEVGVGIAAAIAVALLLALAAGWALGRRRSRSVGSPEDAADAADAALPGFATVGAVVGADGAGALAVDGRGRVAVMKRSGKRIAVREVEWARVRATATGIVVDTGERRFGEVAIAGVTALDVRRLAPEQTKA
jgi:non-ribosomal peptide synthetase component E (peptide arylation enzyme)